MMPTLQFAAAVCWGYGTPSDGTVSRKDSLAAGASEFYCFRPCNYPVRTYILSESVILSLISLCFDAPTSVSAL